MHRISIFLLLPYTPPTPLKRGQKKSPPGKGFWGGFNLIIKSCRRPDSISNHVVSPPEHAGKEKILKHEIHGPVLSGLTHLFNPFWLGRYETFFIE
ncbi:MAG: hypothetical protein B6D35_06620 [Candidatus Brocadia sp. UTAMX2]|nr:MAG: hypothetical protein B6D35_06620 [Candidatus Brocadia sp. UTAMX2]